MKRNLFTKAILAAIFSAVTVFSAAALDATVISATGKVEIQNGTEWVAVKAGDIIPKGAVISTGFKSEAVIKVKSSTFTLTPLTRITVEQLAETPAKDETQLYLDSGNVKFDVKKSENKRVGFKVRSPVATASVRGTAGTVGANGSVAASEGIIAVTSAESPSANIQGDPSDSLPKDGVSNPFTPTKDVGGDHGETPVFAGQTTNTDPLTGTQSAPQQEKNNEARNTPSSTQTLASMERPNDGPATGMQNAPAGDAPKTTTVKITVSWSAPQAW